ncbi:MAG: phosphatase, partial [Coprobacillaceae bacterium]
FPTLEEVLEVVHKHGGCCVLAHPGNNLKGKYELFDDMIALGIDGVEAFSSYHSEEAVEYFYNKGKENNLLITCGSDYHGHTKPSIKLGDSKCTINQNEIDNKLKEYNLL